MLKPDGLCWWGHGKLDEFVWAVVEVYSQKVLVDGCVSGTESLVQAHLSGEATQGGVLLQIGPRNGAQQPRLEVARDHKDIVRDLLTAQTAGEVGSVGKFCVSVSG